MAITSYDILSASHPSELNAMITAGGYVPVGYVFANGSYGLQAVGVGTIEPWGTVTDHELIQAAHAHELPALINAEIKKGRQPIGGVMIWHHAYVQAVGKVTASEEGGVLTPQKSPKIEVSDPPDADLLQKNFDDLISTLKAAGVLL